MQKPINCNMNEKIYYTIIRNFLTSLKEKLFITILFSLPFLIPVWTLSRTSINHGIWQKVQIMNEEGIRFSSQKDYARSIEYFQNALKLAPDQKIIKRNLANAYMELAIELKSKGQRDKAIKVLEQAVDLNSDLDSLHILLAKLYYDDGDLLSAEKEARIALILKPNDPYVLKFLAYLNCLMEDYNEAIENYDTLSKKYNIPADTNAKQAKAEKEVYSNYKREICHPFVIFYPGKMYREHANLVAKGLADTYLKLGMWWNFNPQSEISVYLYPEDVFYKITNSGNYVIGLYDGKIRLLVTSGNKDTIARTAAHEYTHHALMCKTRSNIPFWLNEGLAQYVAGEWDSLRAKMFDLALNRKSLIKFSRMDSIEANVFDVYDRKLAYVQSYVAVEYLIEEYGKDIIKDILTSLAKGNKGEPVLKDSALITYNELESDIREYYTEKRKKQVVAVLSSN